MKGKRESKDDVIKKPCHFDEHGRAVRLREEKSFAICLFEIPRAKISHHAPTARSL